MKGKNGVFIKIFKNIKKDQKPKFLVYLGGGEESRTPVQYFFHKNFYECSLLSNSLKIKLTNKLYFKVAIKIPAISMARNRFVSH